MTISLEPSKNSGRPCPVCGHEVNVDPQQEADDSPCSRCGHLSWFRAQKVDDAIIVNLLANMNPERAEIDRVGELLVRSRTAPHVIVNFHNIDFISSTFVNRLIVLRRTVHGTGGRVTLAGMNQVILEILRINKLDTLFDFPGDNDEA